MVTIGLSRSIIAHLPGAVNRNYAVKQSMHINGYYAREDKQTVWPHLKAYTRNVTECLLRNFVLAKNESGS